MHIISTLLSVALTLAAASDALPWAQGANGVWIANNVRHKIGSRVVDEACTQMNTNNILPYGHFCKYWTNPNGGSYSGTCQQLCQVGGGCIVGCR